MSKSNFKKIKDKMKNARNAVAGLVNSKTVDKEIADLTDFVPYAILNPRYEYEEQMKLLDKWGFDEVEHKFVDTISEKDLMSYLAERKKKTEYEMDGIVVIDCSKIYPHKGGYHDHEFAFKVQDVDAIIETEVVNVLWDPSKDGYLKPKIQIKPIEIGGTTITYVTCFNAKFVVENKIGKGSKVRISRSGDVIPYIVSVTLQAKEPQMPQFAYKWNESGVDLILKNDTDPNGNSIIKTKLLVHFFSTIGVKYLSEGILTKMTGKGYDTVEKILSAKKEDFENIDGLGKKMVDKIFVEIDRAFNEMSLPMFMAGSNFGRGLGIRKLTEIVNMYPNILNEPEKDLKEKIMEVQGFSDISADLFVANLKTFKDFYKKITKLRDLTRFEKVITTKMGDKFKDMTIAFTGKKDKDIETCIISNSGKVGSSVSSKTTILVYDDDADTSTSKFTKATELNIEIMKMSEFKKKYID